MVHQKRQANQVVAVRRTIVLGGQEEVARALKASARRRSIHMSFVARQHATDRGKKARKARRTYRFSKDRRVPEAMTSFMLSRYTFCWAVRTFVSRGRMGVGFSGRWRWWRDEPITSGR